MSLLDKEERFLPLVIDYLPDILKKKAREELGETEETVRDGLQKLKQKIKDKKVPICTDEDFLIYFLRCKKFNISKGFEQVKSYSYQRHHLMNYYGFIFADKIMPVLRHNICGILPKRDHEGRAVIWYRIGKFSTDICEADNVLRALQVLAHFALQFPATQVSGLALISDVKVESFQTLQLVSKYVKFCLPGVFSFPARFQSVHLINSNVIIRTFFAIVRHLMPSKISGRVQFHGGSEKVLLDHFDASILPTEFGGTAGPLEKVSEDINKKIEEFIPTLQASNHYFKRKDTIPFPES